MQYALAPDDHGRQTCQSTVFFVMSEHAYLLHFSLGPVQGFVAQSRRTRDLWASSWLLSQLSGEAMRAALGGQTGAALVLPDSESTRLEEGLEHKHGGLPNRFIASFSTENEAVVAARRAKEAVDGLWQSIADAVWDRDVKQAAAIGNGTETIWKRQIDNFWEIAWVVTPNDPACFSALDQRKNWRTTAATFEPGNHCSGTRHLQELSGWIAPKERRKQKAFWNNIRNSLGELDLAPNEQLCAIALIKRLFPKLPRFNHLETLNWPSTVYLAAVPWLKKVAETAHDEALASKCADYLQMVKDYSSGRCLSERQSRVHFENEDQMQALGRFPALDGNFFNATALANRNGTPLPGDDSGDKRKALLHALSDLNDTIGASASPHYAILLMDGDSLGGASANADTEQRRALTRALGNFSKTVPDMVDRHSGRCVYAGGDDVLAMLPVTTALDSASAIRQAYLEAFNKEKLTGTISAAVLFAHYKLPFSNMLKEAHRLLDEIAKDTTGRDSIAIALHRGSGLTAQWSAPWDYFLGEDLGSGQKDRLWFTRLRDSLRDARKAEADGGGENENSTNGKQAKISASYLYNLRQRVGTLSEQPIDRPGNYVTWPFDTFDRLQFFISEWMVGKRPPKTNEERKKVTESGENLLKPLERGTRRVKREPDGSPSVCSQSFNLDAAFLARFIAEGGKENA